MSADNLHMAWARLFVQGLATNGVRDAVVSPGSRSAPLAIAIAQTPGVRMHVIVDERSAAFFALGQARLSRRPTLLVCTSGTAGAHYLPALIEARQSGVPMIACTADRAVEEYDAGASQVLDQVKLYGDSVLHFAELGTPTPSPLAMRSVLRVAAQAVAYSSGTPPGPVHVNARFRKPLEPVADSGTAEWQPEFDRLLREPAVEIVGPTSCDAPASLEALVVRLAAARRPLIVCGPADDPSDGEALRRAVVQLARSIGAPVLAEASSGLRFGGAQEGVVLCSAFDAWLRDPGIRASISPDVIVQVGRAPVSASVGTWWAGRVDIWRVVVSSSEWADPWSSARMFVRGRASAMLGEVARQLGQRASRPDASWCERIAQLDRNARSVAARLAQGSAGGASTVARGVLEALPAGGVLMLGNSGPIRDVESWCDPTQKEITVVHQRGASGIDGWISASAGTASVTDAPVVALVGDLAFLHDIGGLAALRNCERPVVIVVIQNGGGRLFEQLPVADCAAVADDFERLFVTPSNVSLDRAAAAFGIACERVESPWEIARATAAAIASRRHAVIEAVVPPHEAASLQRELTAALRGETSGRPTVVFLHGYLGSAASWEPIVGPLRTRADCIALTLPGHGTQPALPDGAGFCDAVDAIAQSLPVDRRAYIVGYSMGARLALALAVRHPDRVRAALLVGAHPGLPDGEEREQRARWDDEQAHALVRDGLDTFVESWERQPVFATQITLKSDALERQRRQRCAHSVPAVASAMRSLGLGRMPSQWSALSDCDVPLHFVAGALDSRCAPLAERAARAARRGSFEIVPEAGHNVTLEQPAAFAELLSRFLSMPAARNAHIPPHDGQSP